MATFGTDFITLETTYGYEYSMGDGVWQSSGYFGGLDSGEGMSFASDSYYDQKQKISINGNITYEAEIWFSVAAAADKAPGLIASNYTSSSTMFALTLDVQKGGKIRIHTQHNLERQQTGTFQN